MLFGQTLPRAAFPDLWTFAQAEIAAGNTLHANGNGTTTFGIPDMRGRVRAAKDNMGVRQLPGLQTRFLVSAMVWAKLVARRHTRSRSRSLPTGITSSNSITVSGPSTGDILSKTLAGTSVGFQNGSDNYQRTSVASFKAATRLR